MATAVRSPARRKGPSMSSKTAVTKALQSPQAQSSIRGRATSLAKKRAAEEIAKFKAKIKAKVPQLSKDILQSYGLPVLSGAGGALITDFALDRFQSLAGARGDVLKGVIAVGVGVAAKKYVKSPHLHDAAVGAGIVALYKLGTRVLHRADADIKAVATATKAGVKPPVSKLSGLFDANSGDQDLAGYGDSQTLSGPVYTPVLITLQDGRQGTGYADEAGALYDEDFSPLALNGLGDYRDDQVLSGSIQASPAVMV